VRYNPPENQRNPPDTNHTSSNKVYHNSFIKKTTKNLIFKINHSVAQESLRFV